MLAAAVDGTLDDGMRRRLETAAARSAAATAKAAINVIAGASSSAARARAIRQMSCQKCLKVF
jgi:hypothetical protein